MKHKPYLDELIAITDKDEAKKAWDALVARHTFPTGSRSAQEETEKKILENLGYYAGYFSLPVRRRIEAFYGAVHPILGPSILNPTSEECFELGLLHGSGSPMTLVELREAKKDAGE